MMIPVTRTYPQSSAGLSQLVTHCTRNYASGKNLCSVLHGVKDLRFAELDIPKPGDDQLLIKMDTVGICGSDIHFFKHFAIGPFKIEKPYILGHEGSGFVAGMGKNVKGFKIGDRVTIEPGASCRKCEHCKSGNYHLCQYQLLKGLPPEEGLFRQYACHDADFCYKLPDNMTMEDGALLEPLCVAIHGVRKSGVKAGKTMLVLGAGPIGLMALLASKAFGATNVAITDIADHRLAIAKQCGADLTINVKGKSTEDVIKILKDRFGHLPDMGVECAGFPPSIELSIRGIRDGGCVVFLALAVERVEIPVMDVVCREIDMRGAIKYNNTWPLAISLIQSGQIKFDKLTTSFCNLDQIKEGFARSMTGQFVKVLVKCNP